MQKQIRNAFILLIALFAILALLGILTDALSSLQNANPLLFAFGSAMFIGSIFAWLAGWAAMIRSRGKGFGKNVLLGFSCAFASLTPVQVGADALRSVKMKEVFGVSYTESIAASMAAKGLKFLLYAVLASLAFLTALLNPGLSSWIKVALLSGFAVVAMAAFLFLLPMHSKTGEKIALLFKKLSRFFHPLGRLSAYFQRYTSYLQSTKRETLLLALLLAAISLVLEFASLLLSFLSANVAIPIYSALILFSVVAVLERTPFLPRGIGAVEAAGIVFLSMESFTNASLTPGQIATVIILFDAMRLVVPTIASMLVYCVLFKKG